jgi:spermidine/putrescine transport system ATP-binding protein
MLLKKVKSGLRLDPDDIHVMKKERHFNSFVAEVIDEEYIRFLGRDFKCNVPENINAGAEVNIKINFDAVVLHDNHEDGAIAGMVNFILYKGNYYHITVITDNNEHVYVNTTDIWDDGDRVGVSIAPDALLWKVL